VSARCLARVCGRVASLLLAAMLSDTLAAATSQSPDPFIAAIAQMKDSVAPVVCRARDSDGKPINGVQSVVGTAFFVSTRGKFVTAAHVIVDTRRPNCTPAIYVPTEGWEQTTPALAIRLYNFTNCPIVNTSLDLAVCETEDDLTRDEAKGVRVTPVAFNHTRHPAGTLVGFLGFPLQETTPVSVRGSVAAYWTTQKLVNGELVIDKSSWAGMSGGPVFLADGTVIGIVTNRGTKTREGMTMARPTWLIEEVLAGGKD
jgi:V8-like Glu-specific endopeptidase